MDDECVDYVLTVEEIDAFFSAKNIELSKLVPAEKHKNVPTQSARNFAKTGGVAQAVKVRLKHPEILKTDIIDGLNKAGMEKLKFYGQINVGNIQPEPEHGNLVEVMACPGGCIAGPSAITNVKAATVLLERYVKEGLEDKTENQKNTDG